MLLLPTLSNAQTLSEARRTERVRILVRAEEARRGGHLDEALALIQQAEQIGPTAGTRMLTAQALSQMGRFAASHAAAMQCLRDVEAETQTPAATRAALRTRCEGLRDEVAPRIARLTVRVPAGAPSETEVRVDGDVLSPSQYNVERAVDPGAVTVRTIISGRAPWERVQVLAAGTSVTVDVVIPRPSPVVVRAPPATRTATPISQDQHDVRGDAPPAPSTPGSTQRALAWTSGALGVVLVGGAAVAGAMFLSQRDDYLQANCLAPPATGACQGRYDDLDTLHSLQFAGYIAGGALIATSVILFVTAPSVHRDPAVSFGITPGGLTFGYTRRF